MHQLKKQIKPFFLYFWRSKFQILSTCLNLLNIFSTFPVNPFSLPVVHICGGDFSLEMTDFYGKEGGIAIKRPHLPIKPN